MYFSLWTHRGTLGETTTTHTSQKIVSRDSTDSDISSLSVSEVEVLKKTAAFPVAVGFAAMTQIPARGPVRFGPVRFGRQGTTVSQSGKKARAKGLE